MASKKTIQGRKGKGVCIYCGRNQSDSSGYTCSVCRERYKQNSANRRKKFRLAGLCIKCGKETPEGEHVKCPACLELQMQAYRRRLKTHKEGTEKQCLDCGEILPSEYHRHCQTCYLKRRAVRHFGAVSKWETLLDLFHKQKGVCPYTGVLLTIGVNAELDHKIAVKNGGKSILENLQWTLDVVNTMKWCHDEEKFLEVVRMIYEHRFLEQIS